MVNVLDLANYGLVIAVAIAVVRKIVSEIVKPRNIGVVFSKKHAKSDTIARVFHICAQIYRGFGFLSALTFGVSLLYSRPDTGFILLNEWTAAFVAVWTTFTFAIMIDSTYRNLIAWGRNVRSIAKGPEITFPIHQGVRPPDINKPLHPVYVGVTNFTFLTLFSLGIYLWVAALSPFPRFGNLEENTQIVLLLVSITIGVLYGSYSAMKQDLFSY